MLQRVQRSVTVMHMTSHTTVTVNTYPFTEEATGDTLWLTPREARECPNVLHRQGYSASREEQRELTIDDLEHFAANVTSNHVVSTHERIMAEFAVLCDTRWVRAMKNDGGTWEPDPEIANVWGFRLSDGTIGAVYYRHSIDFETGDALDRIVTGG